MLHWFVLGRADFEIFIIILTLLKFVYILRIHHLGRFYNILVFIAFLAIGRKHFFLSFAKCVHS